MKVINVNVCFFFLFFCFFKNRRYLNVVEVALLRVSLVGAKVLMLKIYPFQFSKVPKVRKVSMVP